MSGRPEDFVTGLPASAFAPEPKAVAPPQEVAVPAKLFAVSVPLKGGPVKVFEYDNNADGQRQLANLIRGERVMAVILGNRVSVEATSTVDMHIAGTKVTQRSVLPDP